MRWSLAYIPVLETEPTELLCLLNSEVRLFTNAVQCNAAYIREAVTTSVAGAIYYSSAQKIPTLFFQRCLADQGVRARPLETLSVFSPFDSNML